MPKSSENLWKFWEELGNLREFPKTSETLQLVFEELKRFMNLLENFGNSSKVFSRCIYDFLKFSESSEVFGKLRKRFKVIFKCLYDFFKFSDNLCKCSEMFGKFLDVIVKVRNGSLSFGAGF